MKRSNELFCAQLNSCYLREQACQAQISSLEKKVKRLKDKEFKLNGCLQNMEKIVKQSEAMEGKYEELRVNLEKAQEKVDRVELELLKERGQEKQLTTAIQEIYVTPFFKICRLRCLRKSPKTPISKSSRTKYSLPSSRCKSL